MDLNYTAEDVAFRKHVRTWLEHNMPRHIKNLEERRAWHRHLYEAGYLGMGWPRVSWSMRRRTPNSMP